jgi:hypothetical protein
LCNKQAAVFASTLGIEWQVETDPRAGSGDASPFLPSLVDDAAATTVILGAGIDAPRSD